MISSCVDPYDASNFMTPEDQDLMVVYGEINNLPGPYYIHILSTVSLYQEPQPISNALVRIENEHGEIYVFTEKEPGLYSSVNTGLEGKVDMSYRLEIQVNEKTYSSTWETIESPARIERVYYEVEEKLVDERSETIQQGIQFYVDTRGEPEDGRYFQYYWEETWEVRSCYESFYDFDPISIYTPRDTNINICWHTNKSTDQLLAHTDGLSENYIQGVKLAFIEPFEQRFRRRYSFLLEQTTMGEEEYRFWENTNNNLISNDVLFSTIPTNIRGNIESVNDNEEVVLGYFSANGKQVERVFMPKRLDLPSALIQSSFCTSTCDDPIFIPFNDFFTKEQHIALIEQALAEGFIYLNPVTPQGIFVGSTLAFPKCIDCRLNGGTINKPGYWHDE